MSGTISWNNETGGVRWFKADKAEWKEYPAPTGFERNAMFLAELRHFLDCLAGDALSLTPFEDGVATLAVALAAKASAAERRRVEVER